MSLQTWVHCSIPIVLGFVLAIPAYAQQYGQTGKDETESAKPRKADEM